MYNRILLDIRNTYLYYTLKAGENVSFIYIVICLYVAGRFSSHTLGKARRLENIAKASTIYIYICIIEYEYEYLIYSRMNKHCHNTLVFEAKLQSVVCFI